jgi:PAS domain S-box-containing protein
LGRPTGNNLESSLIRGKLIPGDIEEWTDDPSSVDRTVADTDAVETGERLEDTGLETTLATIPAPTMVVDCDGVVVAINASLEGEFGYDRDAIVGDQLRTICPGVTLADIELLSETGEAASTWRAVRADGSDAVAELRVETAPVEDERMFVVVVADVSDHHDREDQFTRFERIVETIDDGVYVLDDSFTITMVNDAVTSMTGYSREELLGSSAMILADEETIERAATISEALSSTDAEAATITTTLQTADGESIPVETRFSLYWFPDGSYGQVGVVRDISERRWYEETLTALHDSTRELLEAESKATVADRIVETAIEVLDLSAAAVYLFDGQENALQPAASSLTVEERLDDLPVVRPGDGHLWDVFVDGNRAVERGRDEIQLTDEVAIPADNGAVIPLDDHGVFFVAMRDRDSVDSGTLELLDLLAASAETALERVDREESLRDRDRELRKRNRQLRRLKRTNEIIRRIDAALVDADSRAEIETAVCEKLVASSPFAAAWVGRVEGEELAASSWAGDMTGYIDAIDRTLRDGGAPPSVRAARTGELTMEADIAADLRSERWRTEALTREFQSAIAVPLDCEGVSYGVLTVYTTSQSGFDEQVQTVFAELGETIANALHVVETKKWLSTESVLELELRVETPDDPLARLASEVDGPLELEGVVAHDGVNSAYVQLPDATPDRVHDVADRITGIESVRVLGDEAPHLYELSVGPATLATDIADRGGRIRSFTLDDGAASTTVELPSGVDVREFVEAIESAHGQARLLARHEQTDPDRSPDSFRAGLRERLTDRQHQILRTAYLTGFFDWPRTTTGSEIATSFDVTQPTINRHLRIAQRKCLELLFDDA